MKSVYISGPYTSTDPETVELNVRQAAMAAYEYMRKGWAVFCPHLQGHYIATELDEEKHLNWDDWLTVDIYWLTKCDAIHMLPGWQLSQGAKIEHMAAIALGLSVFYWDGEDARSEPRRGQEKRGAQRYQPTPPPELLTCAMCGAGFKPREDAYLLDGDYLHVEDSCLIDYLNKYHDLQVVGME